MKQYKKPLIEVYSCELKKPIAFSVQFGGNEEENESVTTNPNDNWSGEFN